MPRDFDGAELLTEMRKTREAIESRKSRLDSLEDDLNEVHKRMQRPGAFEGGYGGNDLVRKDAILMCQDRHSWLHQKQDGQRVEYTPSSDEIDEAITAQRAMRQLIHTTDFRRLTSGRAAQLVRLQLRQQRVDAGADSVEPHLSCLTDRSDFLSLLSQETISAGVATHRDDGAAPKPAIITALAIAALHV